jgi:hypothetical protein
VEEEVQMSVDLTIVLLSLNPDKWQGVYDNIETAIGNHTWELLVIGPKEGKVTTRNGKFKYLYDTGHICHCFQRGLLHASGEYLITHAEDGIYLPNALSHPFDADLILCKYTEGYPDLNDSRWREPERAKIVPYCRGAVGLNPLMLDNEHWMLGFHSVNSQYVPGHWWQVSSAILKKDCTIEIGGWDVKTFEISHFSNLDLGIRFQRKGLKCKCWPHIVTAYGYEPGGASHSVIEDAREENDKPNYWKIYNDPACVNRTDIPIQPESYLPGEPWKRRYK